MYPQSLSKIVADVGRLPVKKDDIRMVFSRNYSFIGVTVKYEVST